MPQRIPLKLFLFFVSEVMSLKISILQIPVDFTVTFWVFKIHDTMNLKHISKHLFNFSLKAKKKKKNLKVGEGIFFLTYKPYDYPKLIMQKTQSEHHKLNF